MKKYDVVIIGAGPSGVFCAISLKEKSPEINIAIIEKGKPLKKLLLSGGGRCNFTNINAKYGSCKPFYPRGEKFISALFNSYDYKNFINWLKANNIEIKQEEEGKFYLKSDDSSQIVKLFLNKLKEYRIDLINAVFIDFNIKDFTNNFCGENISKKNCSFIVKFKKENIDQADRRIKKESLNETESKVEKEIKKEELNQIDADFLVVACGSNRKILDLIKNKGINVREFIPSLFSLKIDLIKDSGLAGISLKNVAIKLCPSSNKVSLEKKISINNMNYREANNLKTDNRGQIDFAEADESDYIEKNNIERNNERNSEINSKKNNEINNEKNKEIEKIMQNIQKSKNIYLVGDLLFTHQGLSGPVIFKFSSYFAELLHYCDYKVNILIDFLPEIKEEGLEKDLQKRFHSGAKIIKNFSNELNLPTKLWIFLLKQASIPLEIKTAQISRQQVKQVTNILKNFKIVTDGRADNKEEFVSCGGVDLKEVGNSCQSKKIEKLYFIGEFLNIDGVTGGFNLQSTWTTAVVCANSILKSIIYK